MFSTIKMYFLRYRVSHETWQLVNILKNVFFHNSLSCLIVINIIWQFYYSRIDHRLGYIGVKDFSNELNCKKSLNLIQYLKDDILNYSSTVMLRGTPCRWMKLKTNKTPLIVEARVTSYLVFLWIVFRKKIIKTWRFQNCIIC